MGQVINLIDVKVLHGSGAAFCLCCGHTWEAVAPTGTTWMECPQCHRETGQWKFRFYPSVGQQVRQCGECANQLFYLTPDGRLCASCGVYQRY